MTPRGVLAAGGDVRTFWAVDAIAAFDAAIGRPILRDLYRRLALQPGDTDLGALWRQLGISVAVDGRVAFDDRAPLAPIRRDIVGPAAAR